MLNACLINIGDELLIGQVVNTNASYMAQALNAYGISVVETRCIADQAEAITQCLDQVKQNVNLVLITGGLGPTKDDLTKKVLATYFNTPLSFHQASFDNIERLFAERGRVVDARYRVQCEMPEQALILINRMGTASGMWFETQGCIVISLPGVPREMQYLLDKEVLPRLRRRFQLPTIVHRTFLTTGKGETDLSELLNDWEDALPPHIKLAYLPNTFTGTVRLRLTAKGPDPIALHGDLDQVQAPLETLLGHLLYGYEEESLASVIGHLLQEKQWQLATAESCTGGNIARKIVEIPGASSYFKGGIVAYSNPLKQSLLQVSPEILETQGAVSEACVQAMLAGLLAQTGADCGIAISGIAGPSGERQDKPVGTIWLAYGQAHNFKTKRLQLGKERSQNIEWASNFALNLFRLWLEEFKA